MSSSSAAAAFFSFCFAFFLAFLFA